MPSVRFVHSASGVVRASRSTFEDSFAFEVQTFCPRTMKLSPSRRANVLIEGVSEPAFGSVMPNATWRRPPAASGRTRCFISAVPCRTTGLRPKMVRWSAVAPFIAAPEAEISSSRIEASVMPRPAPPYSGGMAMPSQPASAKAW